jgi:hypothetical protein
MPGLERVLWYLNIAAAIALIARLVQYRLRQSYPWLFFYWVAQTAASLAMLPLSVTSTLYAQAYYVAHTLNLTLAICVVFELCHEALAEYPAMAEFGRKTIFTTLSVTALVAAIGLMLDTTILPGHPVFNHRFLTFERTMGFMVLLFLLAISAFLLWFPVKVRRNITIYVAGFVLFYASRSAGLLVINLLPVAALRLVSVVLLGFSLGCLLLWLTGLRRESDDVNTVTGSPTNAAALERLSAQLDQINTALARFARNA